MFFAQFSLLQFWEADNTKPSNFISSTGYYSICLLSVIAAIIIILFLSSPFRKCFNDCISDFRFFLMNYVDMSPAKRICVFEHRVMTNFNCACPDIQRGQGSGFLSEGSS